MALSNFSEDLKNGTVANASELSGRYRKVLEEILDKLGIELNSVTRKGYNLAWWKHEQLMDVRIYNESVMEEIDLTSSLTEAEISFLEGLSYYMPDCNAYVLHLTAHR